MLRGHDETLPTEQAEPSFHLCQPLQPPLGGLTSGKSHYPKGPGGVALTREDHTDPDPSAQAVPPLPLTRRGPTGTGGLPRLLGHRWLPGS